MDSNFDALFQMAQTRAYSAPNAKRITRRGATASPRRANGTELGGYEIEVRAMALAKTLSAREARTEKSDAWLLAQRHQATDLDPVRDRDEDDEYRPETSRSYQSKPVITDMIGTQVGEDLSWLSTIGGYASEEVRDACFLHPRAQRWMVKVTAVHEGVREVALAYCDWMNTPRHTPTEEGLLLPD